jgi:hypothetical protein
LTFGVFVITGLQANSFRRRNSGVAPAARWIAAL